MSEDQTRVLELTADIVAAYVGNNELAVSDLPAFIKSVHDALGTMDAPPGVELVVQQPAVPIKKSITPDAIICLEDGRKFKSMRRHLRIAYNMTPDDYRKKWGLPSDYPMVAPSYAEARSNLAKSMGLGQQGREIGRQATTGRTPR